MTIRTSAAALAVALAASATLAQTPIQKDDLVIGLSRSAGNESARHASGSPAADTGSRWDAPFVQSMQFDNLNGFQHNAAGNLLGMSFGTTAGGGTIWNLSTRGTTAPAPAQEFFTFANYNAANPGAPLTVSRAGGLSVSPDNRHLAFVGSDAGGRAYVLQYNAGDANGANASVGAGREIALGDGGAIVASGFTQGTTWLDNDSFLALGGIDTDNENLLIRKIGGVNSEALTLETVATLPRPGSGASQFSSLLWEPAISPLLYVSFSRFDSALGVTTNKLWALDPSASYAVVREIDLSVSLNTARELAFDSQGNLYLSQFGGTGSTPLGGKVDVIANAWDAANLTDDSSVDFYVAEGLSSSFNGVDVASSLIDYVRGVTTDLADGRVEQRYFSASPLDQVRAMIVAGYNGGAWNGNGLFSSTAAANPGYGIGYADASQLSEVGTLGGSFVVAYTFYGDTNLDGRVDVTDLGNLASAWQLPGDWINGDFNYDGTVDVADLGALATNWQQGVTGPFASTDLAQILGQVGLGGTTIPEPAGLTLLGVAGLALRRRSH